MEPFFIPDDFRAFMQQVVSFLELASPDTVLDGEDAFIHACGRGGRVDDDRYHFSYLTSDDHTRWSIALREAAVRDIADGLLIEVMAERFELVRDRRRAPVGDPLLIWGEYGDDALSPHEPHDVVEALNALHASAHERPRMLRMWSAADDQIVAVVWADHCALYVIESHTGYATSVGGDGSTDSFEAHDYDGKPMLVPFSDCVRWPKARAALLHFLRDGELGDGVKVEGRIPSMLLMMGEVDRKAVLAARPEPPRVFADSSLPRMATESIPIPVRGEDEIMTPIDTPLELGSDDATAWARRFMVVLRDRKLIDLSASVDDLADRIGGLLQVHGTVAQGAVEIAEWLAEMLARVGGVTRVLATGADLQHALRRSR